MRGSVRFIAPQHRLAYQAEPMVATDPRVRAVLYHAVDRELMAEALQGGHRELAAWEILGPDHIWHEAAKDAMRRYAYDPRRARAILSFDLSSAAQGDATPRMQSPAASAENR